MIGGKKKCIGLIFGGNSNEHEVSISSAKTVFQAEDGIRDSVASRGLGDVYKRQISSPNEKLKLMFLGISTKVNLFVLVLSLIHI